MFSCLSLSLLFLILFCDIFVVLVESLVDSKPGIVEPEVDVVDCGKNFFTDKKYSSSNDLINWVHCEVAKIEFTVVIEKFDHGNDQRKQYSKLGCKSGVYEGNKKRVKRENTKSRKYG
jgi:hypothetical protein